METKSILPLLEQLEYDIDDLEEALQPLLENPLSVITQKLPVLDKAKLYVLVTYAIESLIFSYLRLNGVNAREHPVFKELTRVKQYFQKIKDIETPPEKPAMTLDKKAAGRFIKHGLAGNDKYDLERAEREAKEKAMAQLKAAQIAKKMSAAAASASASPSTSTPHKRGAEEMSSSNSAEDDDEVMGGLETGPETEAEKPAAGGPKSKKKKTEKSPAEKAEKKQERKRKRSVKKEKKKQEKSKKQAATG